MDRRKVDVIVGAVLTIMAVCILVRDDLVVGGLETDLGSMFLPRLLAWFIIAFSLTIGGQALLKIRRGAVREEQETIDTKGYLGIVYYVSIFASYWYLVDIFGFIVCTPFAMIAVMLLLGGRNWKVMLPLSVVAPVLVYYGCYNYLRVMLPVWSL
ncbi:MAG: tripartite tricarboxylate transporter TctB family protein [Desulfobacterales bacterium]|nr:tripartite tricarboxylate transporter TctB family protein [Desulfobacterales bacterium]